MVRADLRKAEIDYRARLALVVTDVTAGWSLKEFAARLEKATGREWDERQLARWRNGQERPQFDALLAIDELRTPIALAFAVMAGLEITTHITVRRVS